MQEARFFLDSNIVLYAIGDIPDKRSISSDLLSRRPVVSTQVLLDFSNVARRKFGLKISDIREILDVVEKTAEVRLIAADTVRHALGLSERYGYTIFDSLIAATAIEAECSILYSEDFQHGQKIAGTLTIIDPFR